MPLRFRRSVKILPGLKLNLTKKGYGLTVGTRGEHVSLNSHGNMTETVGLPGTGLSWQQRRRVFGRKPAVQATPDVTCDIRCPECGEPCSSSWDECPKCGAPLHLELVE